MSKGTIEQINQILSSFAWQNKKGNLAGLRQILATTDFVSLEEKELAEELVASAHLACFNYDPRTITFVIDLWAKQKNWAGLTKLLRLNKLYGQFRQVWQIRQIGLQQEIAALKVPDFKDWFFKFGLKWFDLYLDSDSHLAYITANDQRLIKDLIVQNLPKQEFWPEFLRQAESDPALSPERLALLKKLANSEEPRVALDSELEDQTAVEQRFINYCQENNLTILKRIQVGINNVRRCSYIYLVLDTDGIIKVYKQILDYNGERFGNIFTTEDHIYQQLGYPPTSYSKVRVADKLEFFKFPVKYGQPLSDYTRADNLLGVEEVIFVVKKIAQKLLWLKEHRVLHLDLKPADIFFDGQEVDLLDFGISRILLPGQTEIDIFLANPRYGTPECGRCLNASWSAEIFQLGLIFHELLTGRHPFALQEKEFPNDGTEREKEILNYFWPNIVKPYNFDPAKQFADDRLAILPKMLAKDPQKRPELNEIIAALEQSKVCLPVSLKKRQGKRIKKNNTILFPARMGIPHKGHIEYMNKLLSLGYYLIISLQRAYTITDRDPIPKWLVEKIVAQSLLARGFTTQDFHFVMTPFFDTAEEMIEHFRLLPGMEDVIGIASSNPSVHKLFKDFQHFEQKTVFGQEGEIYEDRSWGEIIRRAIKENNYQTFCQYKADALETILTFSEIQAIYGQPEIDFVSGQVNLGLLTEDQDYRILGSVDKYISPEESLVKYLQEYDNNCQIIDLYAKETIIIYQGEERKIRYVKTYFATENETILFQII